MPTRPDMWQEYDCPVQKTDIDLAMDDIWKLLEIAESANPPNEQPGDSENWCGDVEMPAKDGWKVVFFYDCGELDYIDSFVMPDGTRLDVWGTGYQGEKWPPVMNWRGVGDLERLRGHLTHYAAADPREASASGNLLDGDLG